ncbi:K02A2.6-like [Cordylochernes scorpioides]|uniref:K02A2.6-like n=1 Tax=Cordylochernes scorpioides TaxID=51811 RepID=A0ABY6LI40_9ARAC|nr:K02A2.6-like [Cordylochernes scorpioides]
MELPLMNVSPCELLSHPNGSPMAFMVLGRTAKRAAKHEDERSGRPVTATDNAAVAAVRNVVEADRHVAIDEIMIRLLPGIEIGRSSIGTIMSDVLKFRKVCARWVPRLLSENHKQQRMEAARAFLEMHRRDGDQLFSRIVTGDESWVHHSTPETKRQSMNFKEENGCLYKNNPNPEGRAWVLVVPKKRRKEIMSKYHNHMLNENLGVVRTTYRLKNKYYRPSMLKDVSEFVKRCHLCQSRKGSNHLPSGLLQPISTSNYPFERIGIDFVGPLTSKKRRRKWIIALTDYYTKYFKNEILDEERVSLLHKISSQAFGLNHPSTVTCVMDDYDEYIENYLDKIAWTRQVVFNNTEKTQERMKRNYDKKHNEKMYEPGHLVAVWTPVRKIGKCEKLLRQYFGPYRILKKLSNVNYLIEPKDNPGQEPLIVHVSRLKPYFERIYEVTCRIINYHRHG